MSDFITNSDKWSPESVAFFALVSNIFTFPKFTSYNFKLQAEHSIVEGVCFESSFQKILKQKEETQSAIEIADYSLKRSLKDGDVDSLVVNKKIGRTRTYQL